MRLASFRLLTAAAMLLGLYSAPSQAANGTWTGAADSLWTNSANWSVSPYAGSNTGESALFDSAGGGRTTLDIDGLYSIWGLTFDTENVAAYTLGEGGPNSQTLVMGGSGIYYLTAAAANSQTINAKLQLGGSNQAGSYFLRNENTAETFYFAGDVTAGSNSSAGVKNLSVFGAGGMTFSGNLYKGAAAGLVLTNGLAGTLTLSGSNTLQTLYLGVDSDTLTDIGSGFLALSNGGSTALSALQGGAITGSGKIWLSTVALADNPTSTDYANCSVAAGKTLVIYPEITGAGGFEMNGGTGTFVLAGANTFEAHVALNAAGTLSVSNAGTKGSLTSNQGQGGIIRYIVSGARPLYTGAGETSDRTIRLDSSGTLEHAGAGTLTFTSDFDVRGAVKTLTLQGSTDGQGVLAGAVSNGTATTSLAKAGTGTWTLTGSNTYAGATTVSGGTLVVSGASGSIAGAGGFAVSSNATLRIENTTADNRVDRLSDAGAVTLDSGTLVFSHDAGDASFSETFGALKIAGAGSTLLVTQAKEGQSCSLTFGPLSRTGSGTVNFAGEGLGASGRSRIFIAGQPDGIIGTWATVNGSAPAAYSSTLGVYAGSEVSIAARGPSVIPDEASTVARITSDGTSGPITLAGDPVSHIGVLLQETGTAAEVATAGKTLMAGSAGIAEGQASLSLGVAPGDGTVMTLGAGSPLTFNNDSASALTVNAAIADNGGPSALAKNGTGDVVIAGATAYTGPTAISAGKLIFAGHTSTQTLNGAVSGAGSLAKSGTNTLHLLGANTYTGPTLINAGLVRVNLNTALGSSAAGTEIAAGATLDLGCTPDVGGTRDVSALNMQAELITVQGAGLFGQGAIINSSTGVQINALGKVALSGDATFSGISRWDIRDGTLAMNDRTLTKAGPSTFSLSQVAVTPGPSGTAAFDVQNGALRLQRTTDLGGSASNTVHIRPGMTIDFYDLSVAPAWTLLLDNGSSYNIDNSSAGSQNYWAGPVVLSGTNLLTSDGTFYGGFSGLVSGDGSLVKTNAHGFTVSGTNNTYAGPTRIANGSLYVARLSNLGQPSSIGQPATAENGAIRIGSGNLDGRLYYTGEGDTTDRAIDLAGTSGAAYLSHAGAGLLTLSNLTVSVAGSKTLYLMGSTTGVGVITGMITNNATSGSVAVNKLGTGAWILSGNNRYSGATTVDAGSLALTGNNILPGSMTLTAGSLSISGQNTLNGNVTVNGGSLAYAGTNILAGSLSINSGAVTVSGTNGYGSANLICGGTNKSARLTLTAGAILSGSGDFRFGTPGGNGALYNKGGSILRTQAAGDQNFVFGRDFAYGYLNMTAGSVTASRFQMAGVNAPVSVARGIARISGGTLTFSEYVLLARNPGCESVLTMDGGLLNHINANQNFCLAFAGGRSEVNLTGGSINNTGKNVTFQQNGGLGATGIVNLCAGSLITGTSSILPNPAHFLNFAGGTLKPSAASTTFIPTNFTGVNVYGAYGAYSGGATIDTAGFAVTVPAGLRAPAGNGVYTIGVADMGSGYIGEPYVSIEGPDGVGATAVANLADDGTGSNTFKVASITVTCPGTGYVTPPSVLLRGGGTGVTPAVAGPAGLAPNTSGGLTKAGAGVLTLSGTNTYEGATTVAEGTLKLGSPAALVTGSRVLLAGGTLDLGGLTVTNALTGTGTLTNGTLRAAGFSPGGEGVVASDTLALTLRNAALQVAGTYRADVTASGTSDQILVTGDITLSGLALSIVNTADLNPRKTYTLLTCAGGKPSGTFASSNLADSRWRVVSSADGSVRLIYANGTLIQVL